jgi:Zn-dependent M28 family amino/carboxypeptidase
VLAILIAAVGRIGYSYYGAGPANPQKFNGDRAYEDVVYQVSLGPRTPGSEAHAQTIKWIQQELEQAGWVSEIQAAEMMGHPIQNIVAYQPGQYRTSKPWIILGAHFDSRFVADQDTDPEKSAQPVPGANDGASGVAVLLEMARVLPRNIPKNVWLVFFDAEDNGRLPGWDWILGSRAFVEQLEGQPDAAIIVDMIGDANLDIYYERNSDLELSSEIWEQAYALGYTDQFIARPKYSILDDHTPFLEAGIRAVDLIDFDYPYWHTSEDTADKVSGESLQAVGETLQTWLMRSK